ncbi:MAG TPA: rhomboid family intramembrane serine protease [Candidatus Caccousia avistercoris]|nr:rhomboid family intramembrane serine protease [Candidatus Caccousia avistercoris]
MDWIDRLERKGRRLAIPNLMFIISGGMLLVYIFSLMFPQLQSLLSLNRAMLFQGQVWRLVTFLFIPPASSPLWILFNLYFYCLLGRALETQWGVFRFNLFYFTGALGAVAAALLSGYGSNSYLNLSLFLAFAAFYPDYKLMVFFFLPIKVKYLAAVDVLFFVVSLVLGSWADRAAILMSVINVILFFGGSGLKHLKTQMGYWKTRRNFRKYMK